jgi:hypothetical protein
MSLQHRPARIAPARLLFAALALCAIFAVTAGRADAAPWSAPEEVSPAGNGAYGAQVAMDGAGDATAVWTETENNRPAVKVTTRPVGGAWETPETISTEPLEDEEPVIAVDEAGDAVVAWRESAGEFTRIQVDYRPAGGSWTGPQAFSAGIGSNLSPRVAIDSSGDAALVWQRGDSVMAALRPTGGSWSSASEVSPSGTDATGPEVVIDATGQVTVAWLYTGNPFNFIDVASKPIASGSWTVEAALSSRFEASGAPQLSVDAAGEVFVVWTEGTGTGNIEFASRDTHGSWGTPETMSSTVYKAESPQLAANAAGDLVLAWKRAEGAAIVVEGAYLRAGGSWSSPHLLSEMGGEAETPTVAIGTGGVAEVAWSTWSQANHAYETRAARLGPLGAWKAAVLLGILGHEALTPHVRVSPGGHVVIVWNGSVSIESVTREELSPLAIGKKGNGTGTVTSEPAGIDCGSECIGHFLEGETVTLFAEPDASSSFAGWSGACSGTGTCTVEVGEAPLVGAEFLSAESETTGGGSTGGDTTSSGSTTTTTLQSTTQGPSCHPISAASVTGFVPTPKPGHVVPGVRAAIGVRTPSQVQVTATLAFGKGSQLQLKPLGTVSFHAAKNRNLRFAIPAKLRSRLPLGSSARLILSIAAKPDSDQGCGTPGAIRRTLGVKVVKVLSGSQAGVS